MVSLKVVQASNDRIAATLPPGLVAVFVGATSGIGEYTLKEFAQRTRQPRIYNIGRSKEASDRISAECKKLNPEAQYTFIQGDVGLIRTVDAVCEQIKAKEKAINILFLSAGTLVKGIETKEGLHLSACLKHHSRARFILNLLPLLESATAIRRVVSVLSGSKEGAINLDNIQGWNDKESGVVAQRGHGSSVLTLIHLHFARQAPTVSFIHDYPGAVRSGISRGTSGLLFLALTTAKLLGPLIYIPDQESGARHLFFATSAMYPAKEGDEKAVPLDRGLPAARGIDGEIGSGVYSADQTNESAGPAVEQLVESYKKDGLVEKVWGMVEDEYERIAKLPQ